MMGSGSTDVIGSTWVMGSIGVGSALMGAASGVCSFLDLVDRWRQSTWDGISVDGGTGVADLVGDAGVAVFSLWSAQCGVDLGRSKAMLGWPFKGT